VRIFLESKGHKPTSGHYLTQPPMAIKGQAKKKLAGMSPPKRNGKNSETDRLICDKPMLEPNENYSGNEAVFCEEGWG